MNQSKVILVCIGLAVGAIFGIAGGIFSEPYHLQAILYEISSVGLVISSVLLTLQFLKEGKDYVAAGFLIFAIGEAVMSAGAAAGAVEGQASFGAGMALYVPAFLMISIPKVFPTWVRVVNIAASIPFCIAAATIYTGGEAFSSSPIVGAGYGLLVLSIIGWIMTFVKESKVQATNQRLAVD